MFKTNIVFSIFILLAAFFVTGFTTTNTTNAQSTNESSQYNSPRVYVTKVSLDNTTFNAGDTITGVITLYNGSSVDAGTIDYSLKLLGSLDAESKQPTTMLAESEVKSISIASQETKVIPFSFKLPKNINEPTAVVRVWVTLPSGTPLSWKDADTIVNVKAEINRLRLTKAYVKNSTPGDERTFTLQEGISLYQDKDPKSATAHLTFSNENAKDASLTPVIKVYERLVGEGNVLFEQKLSAINISAKQSGELVFSVPNMDYRPGLYEASIEGLDASGENLFPTTRLRFIIQGDIATIHSVSTVSTSIEKGSIIAVEAQVSGTPVDVLTGENPLIGGVATYDVVVNVKNQSGTVIAEANEKREIGNMTTLAFNLTANDKADSTSVFMEISKDGKILATYDNPLTLDKGTTDEKKDSKGLLIGLIVLIILILLIIITLMRKKKGNPIVGATMAILFALSVLIPGSAMAASFDGWTIDAADLAHELGATTGLAGVAGVSHSITISEPFENQKIAKGASFTTRGTHTLNACWNVSASSNGKEHVIRVNDVSKYNMRCKALLTTPGASTIVKGGSPRTVVNGNGAELTFAGRMGHAERFGHNTAQLAYHDANVLAVDATFIGKTSSSFAQYGLYYQLIGVWGYYTWGSQSNLHDTSQATACQPFWIVPTTVTGLTIDPNKECGKIHLSWTAHSDPTVTTYRIYRSESDAGTYTRIGEVTAATTYIDTTPVNGTKYYYKVSAYHVPSQAESEKSSSVNGATPITCASGIACTVTRDTADKKKITWAATVTSGAIEDYNISWTGHVTSTVSTVTQTFADLGPKSATLTATHKTNGKPAETKTCDITDGCGSGTVWCPVTNSCNPIGTVCQGPLSCSTTPANPTLGSTGTWQARWNAPYTDGVGEDGLTYAWSGEVTGGGKVKSTTFNSFGTKTATVTSVRAGNSYTISCTSNITCGAGRTYCASTNTCIDANGVCPSCPNGVCGGGPGTPACGTRTYVAAGGTLDNPTILNYPGDLSPVARRNKLDTAAQFSLCAQGSELTPGSLFINQGQSKWNWTCKQVGVTGGASVSCDAACLPGTQYNPIKGYCAVDCPDWCPNIPGLQPTRGNYIIDADGNCVLPEGSIVYFRAKPDTASSSCPAFWKTEAGLGARMDCRLNNVTEVDFPAQRPEGGPARLIEAGKKHTLTCDLKLTDNNYLVRTYTASTRCYKIGDVREQ